MGKKVAMFPGVGSQHVGLVCPLRWQTSLDYLLQQGVDTAVEMGPDKVLKMLVKNNTTSIST